MANSSTEDEGVNELVGMRGSDEDDWVVAGDAVGCSRVDFAEEEIDNDTEDPEEDVVDKIILPCWCHGGSRCQAVLHGMRRWGRHEVMLGV